MNNDETIKEISNKIIEHAENLGLDKSETKKEIEQIFTFKDKIIGVILKMNANPMQRSDFFEMLQGKLLELGLDNTLIIVSDLAEDSETADEFMELVSKFEQPE